MVDLQGSAHEEALLRRWALERRTAIILVSSTDRRRFARSVGATFFQRPVPVLEPRRGSAAGGDTLPDALWAVALAHVVDGAMSARRAHLDTIESARHRVEDSDEPPRDSPLSGRNGGTHAFVPRDVLVVDDDYGVRRALSEALEEHGYSVAVAEDGQAALDLCRRSVAPRLILLDLMMPRMDGWQLRDALRQDPALADIPVAVVSVLVPFDQQSALDVEALVKKPIDLDHLLHTVESLIG